MSRSLKIWMDQCRRGKYFSINNNDVEENVEFLVHEFYRVTFVNRTVTTSLRYLNSSLLPPMT